MAVRRNGIPRSLIGAGGVRLYDIPGVIYPREMLRREPNARAQVEPEKEVIDEDCEILPRPPIWGMPTAEVARQMGCSIGAARMRMQRHGVQRVMVRITGGAICSYWRREQVRNIIGKRNKDVEAMPSCYLSATATAHLLQLSRSSLARYEKLGKLKPVRVMFRTGEFKCIKSYYLRSEVRRLSYHLNSIRNPHT